MKRVIIINMSDHVFTLMALLDGIHFKVKRKSEGTYPYYKAIYRIARCIMLDKLMWIDNNEKNHVNESLASEVVDILQMDAGERHQDKLINYIDEAISEYLYSDISRMLAASLKSAMYNHWDMRQVGRNLILKSGGIMVDLDRLEQQTGVVEIDLEEHWKTSPIAEKQDDE